MAAIFKSNMAAVQNVYCSIAPQRGKSIFSGSGKQMGRFINCFILVILKFKILSISPQRVMIANDFKVCVCSVYCAILCSS